MTVRLLNVTRRMKVFQLPHDPYCTTLGACACIALPRRKTRVASSLTLPASVPIDCPEAALKAPEVLAAIRAGKVQVFPVPATTRPDGGEG